MRHVDRARKLLAKRRSRPETPDLRSLIQRVDALEAMVEGLQDSVDRQTRRQDERINELARRLEPAQLARTISDDARERGL
jgi:hypothetical protein